MAQSSADTLMAQALADAVGATKRQIQTWTDAGVLQCRPETDRRGTGIRRQYERGELPIAAFVAFLAKFRLQIGELKNYARIWREWVEETERGEGVKETLEWRRRALKGDRDSWVIVWPLRMPLRMDGVDSSGVPLPGKDGLTAWFKPEDFVHLPPDLVGGIIVNIREIVSPFVE